MLKRNYKTHVLMCVCYLPGRYQGELCPLTAWKGGKTCELTVGCNQTTFLPPINGTVVVQ